jgi:hypothetical protein
METETRRKQIMPQTTNDLKRHHLDELALHAGFQLVMARVNELLNRAQRDLETASVERVPYRQGEIKALRDVLNIRERLMEEATE